MIAVIFVRICIELACMLLGGAATLVLVAIGRREEAFSVATACSVLAWALGPNAEDRALFAEYQRQHAPPHNIE